MTSTDTAETSQSKEPSSAIFKALFLGHSLVKQLAHKAYEIGQPGLNCDKQFTVLYHSIKNLTIKQAYDHLFLLDMIKPHVIVLDLGSHDLAEENADPYQLVQDIKALAEHIMEKYGVLRVVVSEMYYRKHTNVHPIRDDFIGRLFDYNSALRNMVKTAGERHGFPLIMTHAHRGLFKDWENYIDEDGFHLTSEAAFKYLKSMRGSLFRTRTSLEADTGHALSKPITKLPEKNENLTNQKNGGQNEANQSDTMDVSSGS